MEPGIELEGEVVLAVAGRRAALAATAPPAAGLAQVQLQPSWVCRHFGEAAFRTLYKTGKPISDWFKIEKGDRGW